MLRTVLLALVIALPAGTGFAGQAETSFVAPEKFRDPEFRRAPSRDAALLQINGWFQDFATKNLAPGQTLRVQVSDVDLAGDFQPWNKDFRDVRILRDVTPPRIRFDWQLVQDGRVMRQGHARLTDLNYLSDPRTRGDSTRFSHDRRLVTDWLRKTFRAS